ncbi:MAG: hypothetical protein QM504_06650 [Pseudomonadota bacterium]
MTNSNAGHLPLKCIAYLEDIKSNVLITKYTPGYVPILDISDNYIKNFNDGYKVTAIILKAMVAGATKGWDNGHIELILQGGEHEK